MSISRIITLLGKELSAGLRNFIFIFSIVVPIVVTVVISALFGTLFLGQPKLGLADQGESRIVTDAAKLNGVSLKMFDSELAAVGIDRHALLDQLQADATRRLDRAIDRGRSAAAPARSERLAAAANAS